MSQQPFDIASNQKGVLVKASGTHWDSLELIGTLGQGFLGNRMQTPQSLMYTITNTRLTERSSIYLDVQSFCI